MKVTVNQSQLAHGLSVVSRAVSARSTLPVLANVLVATDDGRLRLSATNLEMGISCWLGAQISDDGAITVPARTFADLIGTLPNDSITLTADLKNMSLVVKCGASVTEIKGVDANEFPPVPVPDLATGLELNVADFKEMIQQVVFTASTDEARPVLQGVLMTINGSDVVLAATDGFRISVRKSTLSAPVSRPIAAIIPARALSELGRIATDGEQLLSMVFPAGRGQVIFHLKETELSSQLIDGAFPDYKVIIPRSFKTHTVLSTEAFLKACRQAEIIARAGNNVIRMNINSKADAPGTLEISAQSEETGSSDIVVDASIDGPGLLIAFNVRYLREVLDVIKTPNVSLDCNQHNTPGMIRPVGDENYTHVIMPMYLG